MALSKEYSTEMTSMSVLDTITEDHLKCHICLSTFTEPKLLDCHHTFCRSCLEEQCRNQGRSCREIVCPDCRQTTTVGAMGASGLKSDFKVASMVDNVASMGKKLRKQQGALICYLCDKEVLKITQCRDCDVLLCLDCWRENESNHGGHDINILDPGKPAPDVPKCRKHRQLEYSIFCRTCKTLICPMCAATSHRSSEHKYQDIDEADQSARQELALLQSLAESKLKEYTSQRKIIKENRVSMEERMAAMSSMVKAANTDEEAMGRILEKLQVFLDDRLVEFSSVLETIEARIEWFTNSYENVSKQVTDLGKHQLLLKREELLICLKDLLHKSKTFPTPTVPKLLDMTYNSSSWRSDVIITSPLTQYNQIIAEQIYRAKKKAKKGQEIGKGQVTLRFSFRSKRNVDKIFMDPFDVACVCLQQAVCGFLTKKSELGLAVKTARVY